MKMQFAAFAVAAAMLAGTSAAYACKDDCDCAGKKDAAATTTSTTATATPASVSTDKQEQTAQPAPGR